MVNLANPRGSNAGFLYVRGRRRVGKSWLLTNWCQQKKNRIYFCGKKDLNSKKSILDFISTWSEFSNDNALLELKPQLLTWDKVFSEIIKF